MKRKYILSLIVLLGLGIVSTMAFTLFVPVSSELPKAFGFAPPTQTLATVSTIRSTPFRNGNGMRINIALETLTQPTYVVGVELYDVSGLLNLAGASLTISGTGENVLEGVSILEEGYIEVTFTAIGDSDTVTIIIELDGVYDNTTDILVYVS